jgi:uncharacterized delta-60 repeat protein
LKKLIMVLMIVLVFVGCPNPATLTSSPTPTPGQVATPTFSLSGGTYGSNQSVTISSSTVGATVYYTTNGTAPTASSAAYGGAISMTGDGTSMTIKAIATKSGMTDSTVAQSSYTIHYSGTLDAGFNAGGIGAANGSSPVYSVAVQSSDQKILIGGSFNAYNGTTLPYLARLNTDGTLDSGFPLTGSGPNTVVYAIVMQSNGQILIGGDFTTYNATGRGYVARLNSDGTLDAGFAAGAGANFYIYSVAVQSDSKALIGGAFASYSGAGRGFIARLISDGTLDTSFLASGPGANNVVNSVAMQSNGQILIGGNFTTYNSTIRGYLARLNTDGSIDTGFATGPGANTNVNSVAMQSDGKVLIGGNFTTYDSTSRGYVARLNTDGSLDTSFLATGAGANGVVYSVAVQSDGKILIGGGFTTYNGISRGYIARLNTDGSLDTSFLATGVGADDLVRSIAVQSDGKILIGGTFNNYNGTIRGHIARLWN